MAPNGDSAKSKVFHPMVDQDITAKKESIHANDILSIQ